MVRGIKKMNLIEKAIKVAAKAHKQQYRKDSDIPYIIHPYAVGMILMQYGCSEEIIAAGILHDTVEDTELTFEDISSLFGEYVEQLVRGASEKNKELTWEERKQHTIDSLQHAQKDVCLVVCADKLHNLRSIRKDIEQIGVYAWTRFKRGKEKQEWYYRSVTEKLEKKLQNHQLIIQLKNEISKVFGENMEKI